ncbi:MAG: FAD-dependent thymidylate synthase [Agathobacter sp.]
MKIIKPYVEIITQANGYEGMFKHIELCGRVCYKSEDKITDTSYIPFIRMLIDKGHTSVLEHGTVMLCLPINEVRPPRYHFSKSELGIDENENYVTTNFRYLYDQEEDVKKYWCDHYYNKRITARFVLPIGISREFCRHRAFSFSEQSTRYCNYSLGKFGSELTFIEPYWWDDNVDMRADFLNACDQSENFYLQMMERGASAQQARDVLPLATKTELVMTGFVSDWYHFFKLRCAENAHPQARALATNLKELFKTNHLYEV